MRKNIFFIICLLGFGIASAQFSGVGVKAGLTNYKFNDDIAAKSSASFHVGAFANYEFDFSDYFFLQGGLLFTKKGSKLDIMSPGSWDENSFDYKRKFDYRAWYLNIPILAGAKYDFSEDLFVFFNVGPSFNIGLFGETDRETTEVSHPMFLEGDGTFKTFDLLKRFDISAYISAGVSYKNFLLGVSYDYGFIPVKKDKATEPNATNGCFMLSVGFMFPLNEDSRGGGVSLE